MNKSFRSVWNASKQAYVAAAETVSAKGKPSSSVKLAAIVGGLMGSLLATGAHAQTAPPTTALPTGGQVSAGQARIGQSGANMVIQQSTDRAAIDWQSFNVGKDAKVQFAQPNASSVTLNRVLSNDLSQIFGQITANGQVILTNPSGVYFGKDARVDVGGLIATTHGMSDADFMAGKVRFERNGSTASVVNEGELKASLGGYIALLAPEVRNQGAVIAHMGTVALAAGESFDLKFDSNNRLTSLRVEASQIQALVDNRLAVQAPGGLVIISAQSMDRLVGGVVNNSGNVEATGLQQQGGRIVLSGSTRVQNTGTLNASSTEAAGQGGSISLQGDKIDLQSSSRISATGPAGGGAVLVGGNWQGSTDPLLQATAQATASATTVSMASGATIDASATQQGDGGKVVLWSEKTTDFAGRIAAQGAGLQGAGGNAEVSGKTQLNYTGQTNLLGSQGGKTGNLLLDPYNLYITTDTGGSLTASGNNSILGVTTLTNALTTANVTVSTGSSGSQTGNIGVMTDITAPSHDLTLTAAGNVVLAGNVTMGGQFTVNAGGNFVMGTNLNTAAGVSIAANSGFAKTGSGTSYLTGNITTSGTAINLAGPVQIANFNTGGNPQITLSSGGGNITISGAVSNYSGTAQDYAVTMASNLYDGVTVSKVAGSSTDLYLSYGTAGTNLFLGMAGLSGVNYLLVGGGGGSGGGLDNNFLGGGGGGGGVYSSTLSVTPGSNYSVTVGAAGANGSGISSNGTSGGDSGFNAVWVGGGGGGGASGNASTPASVGLGGYGNNNATGGRTYVAGGGGGGGGGAGSYVTGPHAPPGAGGTGSTLTGSAGQIGAQFYTNTGGYGGGAGGLNNTTGVASSITGVNVEYGVGGAGAASTSPGTGGWKADYVGTQTATTGAAIISYRVGNATTSAASALKLNAGIGSVTLASVSNLSSLDVTAASTAVNGTSLVTTGAQTYNNALTVTSTGNLNFGATTLSVTNANQGLLFKAAGNITTAASTTVQTNGGAITYWADSDASGQGFIWVGTNNTLDSRTSSDRTAGNTTTAANGGNITLGGGADLSTGYATSTGTDLQRGGVNFGSQDVTSNNTTNIYSGGGNILARGKSTFGMMGLHWVNGGTFNAGSTGTISLEGVNTSTGHGLELSSYPTSPTGGIATLIAGGGSSSSAAISIIGSTSATGGSNGIKTKKISLQSTGSGGITVTGSTGSNSGKGIGIYDTFDVLAASGPITFNGGAYGIDLAASTWGQKAATLVTSSSSSITLTGDTVTFSGATSMATSGALTVQPYSTSFSSALTWPLTNLTLSSGVSGLTLGKAGNTADITIGSATSIAGPISIYGGNINLNANLTSTLSGAAILAKATGNITQGVNSDVTTVGGSVTYWADSDANYIGRIDLTNGTSGNKGITTNGGAITMGGGTDIATGYAYGYGNTLATMHGININEYRSLNAGTGAITLRGATSATLDDWIIGVRINGTGSSVTGGNLTFVGNASGAVSQGITKGAWGTAIVNGASVTGSGTINISGTGGSGTTSGANSGVYINSTLTATSTGTVAITGQGGTGASGTTGSNHGITLDSANAVISTNNGNVSLTGTGGGGGAGTYNQGVVITSGRVSAGGNGTVNIMGTGGSTAVAGQRGVVISTGGQVNSAGGAIAITGTGGATGTADSSGVSLGSGAGTTTIGSSTSGAITLTGTGYGTGSDVITDATTTLGNASATSNITLNANSFSFTGTTITSTGTLTIQPRSNSFTSAVNFPAAGVTLGAGLTGLTLGKSTNTANINVGSAASIAGPISIYGGDITINAGLTATGTNTISLTGTGNITDGASGFVSAANLALSGGNVTLDNASNAIGTLAASGVSGLTYVDSNALSIGTVGGTNGVSASGTVAIGTLTGDLTLAQNVATTNATATALVLNAGISTAAGTSTGGNLLVTGTPTVSVGTGGTAKLFSGSISASTGLTNLVGSGSGRFRYNSDESATNYTTALATGLNAIYRERPSASGTISSTTITYGDATPTFTMTGGALQNGDGSSGLTIVSPSYSTANLLKASGTAYAVSATGLTGLGYNVSGVTNGALTVNAKALTSSGLTAANKVYNATTTAVVSGTAALQTAIAAGSGTSSDGKAYTLDTVSITGTAVGNFNTKDVATANTVTFTGLSLTGTDASNYTLTQPTNDTTARITAKALTASGLTTANKVYDATTIATVTGTAALQTAIATGTGTSSDGTAYTGDTVSLTGTAVGNFNTKDVATANTVSFTGLSLTGAQAGNYTLTQPANYTTARITAKALTVSGVTSADKVYDATTTATVSGTAALQTAVTAGTGSSNDGKAYTGDTISLAGTVAANFNTKDVATANTVAFTGLSLTGAQAGNYTLTQPANDTTRRITAKALTASGLSTADKVYNGTTTAVVSGTAALQTAIASGTGTTSDGKAYTGDTVSLTGTAVGNFNTKYVATANTVAFTGLSLTGAQAGNYTLTQLANNTTARITAKALTVSGISAANKVYDATTLATVTGAAALQTFIATGTGTSSDGTAYTGDIVSLTGTAVGNFNTKDVATANTVAFTGLSLSGAQAGNYTLTQPANNTTARITAKALTVNGLSSADKVYDGTTVAAVIGSAALQTAIASGTGTSTDGKSFTGDAVGLAGSAAANFNTKDVATANTVAFTGLSLTGAQAGNYTLTSPSDTAPRITSAALTVIANNDAKFVTTADPTFTLGYYGFVNGETSTTPGVWTTTPTVSVDRTNTLTIARGITATGVLGSSGNEAAGTFANALVPTGGVAPNYQVTTVKGSYTIVPAEQLLVRVQSASSIYGTAPTYTVTSAKYFAPSGNPASPISVGTVNVTGNAVSLNDGAGTSATFNLSPVNAALSTTSQTNAGAYQLDGSGLVVTSSVNPNFSRLTVVGDLSVAPKALTANANNATKVYDGTTSAAGVSVALNGVVTSGALTDAVNAGGNGQFATRNTGSTTYTISNLALTGSDAGNYRLSSAPISGSGTITPKAVTFSAPTGTKVYDGQTTYTVAAADLAAFSAALGVTGDTVSGISFNFDNKNVGTGKTLTPSSAVIADRNSGGNYTITYANNTQSSVTRLNSVTWVGGASGNWFDPANWAGGAVPDLSNVGNVVIPSGVTVSFGSTVVAPAQSGAVNIDSLTGAGGNLSQSAGTLNVGTGGILLASLAQTGGTLTNAGPTTLDSFNQSGGSFAGTGNMTAASFVQTGGSTTLGGNLTVTQDFSQGPSGSVSVGGNVSITDTTGGVQLGNLTSTGTLGVVSTDGAITQAIGTAITAQSTSSFTATQGGAPADITLGNSGNDFVGAVNLNGRNVTIVDANSLTLGNVTATGNLNAKAATDLTVNGVVNANTLDLTATTGNITEGTNGTLTVVTGPTNLTAGGNITLGGANDFNGAVNATGNNITLNDVNSLTLGNVTAAGNLNAKAATDLNVNGVVNVKSLDLTATTGNITEGTNGTLTVITGPTNLTAGGNITLGGANDFNGAVNATGNNITLNDVNSLTLGNVTAAGNLNAKAATDLAVNGVVKANTLDLTATTGNITQGANGTLTVATGPSNLTAGGNISLAGANDFNGAVNATGNNITLNDVNSLTLGNVTATGIVNATGNLNATAVNNLAVNSVVIVKTLDLTATTGNITQPATGTITVTSGPSNLIAGGTINLDGTNNFTGVVNKSGGSATRDVASKVLANNPTPPVLGTSLSNANIPQPMVMSSSTQTLVTKDAGSSASSSSGGSQASGISIEQRNAPSSTGLSMMFAVSLPKGTSTMGVGFSFDLPESVRTAASNSSDIRANLPNGASLPAWLKFDAKTLRFDATAVPDGAFPLQVELTFGGQRTLVVISERAE